MKNKTKMLSSLLLLVTLGIGGVAQENHVEASGLRNDNMLNPDNATRWQGDHAQVGKLRYGLVENTKTFSQKGRTYSVGSPSVELVPEDAYVNGKIKESKVIRHIFDAQLYKVNDSTGKIEANTQAERYKRTFSTSFGLVILETEAQNARRNGFINPGQQAVMFFDGNVSGDKVQASGTTEADFKNSQSPSNWNTWNVDFTMAPNADHSAILHTYKMTNKSNETKTFTPIKQVDTQLDYNDFVQIFSRGPGKGLYIETYEDSLPYDVRPKGEGRNARLDYIINPNRATDPVQYSGNGYAYLEGIEGNTTSALNLFGKLGAAPIQRVKEEMSAPEGTAIFGWDGNSPLTKQYATDTAIYLNWGQKTLAPGESTTMTYEVGMEELSPLDLDKTYENKNPQVAGQNTEGDVITYKVKVASPEYNIKDILVTDPLSKYFEEPVGSEKVVVTNKGGAKVAEYAMSDVFTKNTNTADPYVGTLTIPKNGTKPSVTKNDILYYTYDVKLAKGSGGQRITNTAKITAASEDGRLVSGEATTQAPIDVVAANTAPKIEIDGPAVALKLNAARPTKNEMLDGVKVIDNEENIPLTDVQITESIDMGNRAQNFVTYTVKDSGGLTATATRTYIVGGFVGKTHVLFVEDFVTSATRPGVGYPNLELGVKEISKARVEKLHNTTVVSDIKRDIQVPNLDGYSSETGIYRPEITTTLDPSISGKTVALVGYDINEEDDFYSEKGIARMTSLPKVYSLTDGRDLENLIFDDYYAAVSQLLKDSTAFAWDSTTRESFVVNEVIDIEDINVISDKNFVEYQTSYNGLGHKNTVVISKTR